MQEGASIGFDPIRPSRLELWEILLASVLFVFLIVVIVWKLRRRSTKEPESLELNDK